MRTHLSYWKDQLRDAHFLLQLRTDFPRLSAADAQKSTANREAKVAIVISSQQREKVAMYCKSNKYSVFDFLLGVFQLLMYRYCCLVFVLFVSLCSLWVLVCCWVCCSRVVYLWMTCAVFQLVFGLILIRYTGQDDLIVGTAVANRGTQMLDGLIGYFVNMLAMRAKFTKAGVVVTTQEFFNNVRK